MLDEDQILSELTELMIPKASVKQLTEEFAFQLEERLMKSHESMLPSNLSYTGVVAEDRSKFYKLPYNHNKILSVDFGGTTLKFAIIKTYPIASILYIEEFEINENKIVNLNFFKIIIERILLRLTSLNYGNVNDSNCHNNTNLLFNYFFDNDIINNKLLNIPVTITFSFPINSDFKITSMGKGYQLTDEIKSMNIVELFQNLFDFYTEKFQVHNTFKFSVDNNIINDSIAVHFANKLAKKENNRSSEKLISLILGTGINSCFELPIKKLPAFKQEQIISKFSEYLDTDMKTIDEDNINVILNSEVGFLGKDIVNLTNFDYQQGKNELFMPLEFTTSGNYVPKILKKILVHYNILPIDELEKIDGKFITNELSKNFDGIIAKICQILIKRASIYIVSVIFAIESMINDHTRIINVGYIGSFLQFCQFYQEEIVRVSNGLVRLNFLRNSSIIGSSIANIV
ncbi:hypothetical protein KAFR_0E04210 [Kazachstania africana CBS 2517]|uniref:Uncharacterized protein n=1 Tax=Kazachstania africana (strain ATCC 22294 / BCRC 22015 / CBS 2517 / CECT 1963 / NBRC 1671 / NRRL Y-8276) TaxID=1071382 RepID=H2AW22_KAZAF|nr:hypothetical protein KAFR_0E04210 [Kazachstania africana CBS 2517]CCF58572.1 hypothetical protein KAFR_0E04210 [Kazachstania africana CBS 2517]